MRVSTNSPTYSCGYSICNIVAVGTLPSFGDEDLEIWILVENLLYPTIVTTLLPLYSAMFSLSIIAHVIVL